MLVQVIYQHKATMVVKEKIIKSKEHNDQMSKRKDSESQVYSQMNKLGL